MSRPHQSGHATGPSAAESPRPRPLSKLAVAAFVSGVVLNVVGIVCGHIALARMKHTGARGRGLALAGTLIGYTSLALTVVGTIAILTPTAPSGQAAIHAAPEALSDPDLGASLGSVTAEPESPARSPEFCAALDTARGVQSNPNAIEYSAREIAAYRTLGALESPHREVYAKLVEFMRDPTLLTSDAKFNTILGDFSSVLAEDAAACDSGRGSA